jgi:D-alanyl-lipoteichoic acid acyltransferase DltB (MBOAT superfamily)
MLFNSHIFLFGFLPICLLVFFWLGNRGRLEAAMAWLVMASLFFYGWWNPVYLLLLGASIGVNFHLGRQISLGRGRHLGKFLLLAGVTFNLGLLAYFKYMNFLVDSVNVLAGTDFYLEKIVLPLAISFFTFQQIAYLVDAYQHETHEYSFLHYCLFVTFFPQLIAGPIVHHREMLSQFQRPEVFRPVAENISVGLTIFAIGLFKKVVLADTMAPYAITVFGVADQGGTLSLLDAWAGLLAYFFQLYFDFSGYSDMAIGLARLFGIRLPMNFNSPYKATNIAEVWRRWHITLTRFLTQYVYITAGGSRKGFPRYLFNLWLTMFLAGVWHGAGANFVLFGVIQGCYMAIHGYWKDAKTRLPLHLIDARARTIIAWFMTILFWLLALAIFRASTLSGGAEVLRAMFDFNNVAAVLVEDDIVQPMLLMAAITWLLPNTQQIMHRYNPVIEKVTWEPRWRWQAALVWEPSRKAALFAAGLAVAALLMLDRISEFLYFQF